MQPTDARASLQGPVAAWTYATDDDEPGGFTGRPRAEPHTATEHLEYATPRQAISIREDRNPEVMIDG